MGGSTLVDTSLQSAFPKNDGNLFEWIGTIEGPAETVRIMHTPLS